MTPLKRILLLFIVITFSTIYLTSYNPEPVYSTQEAIDRVASYTSGSSEYFEDSLNVVVTTTQTTLVIAQELIDTLLAIPRFFGQFNFFNSDETTNLGEACISYEDLGVARQVFLSTQFQLGRVFALGVFDNFPYENVSEYWDYLQFRDYGLVCS
jgi:hypothetical protein